MTRLDSLGKLLRKTGNALLDDAAEKFPRPDAGADRESREIAALKKKLDADIAARPERK